MELNIIDNYDKFKLNNCVYKTQVNLFVAKLVSMDNSETIWNFKNDNTKIVMWLPLYKNLDIKLNNCYVFTCWYPINLNSGRRTILQIVYDINNSKIVTNYNNIIKDTNI